jgi:hypothetical protein
MWKNGSAPTSTSSAPIRWIARICSMLATRLRWVSITPLESPVVPLEKGSTARSAVGSTDMPASPSPAGSDSSANTLSRRASDSAPRSGSATIAAVAPAVASCAATSAGVSSGLIGVTTAPSETTAWNATGHAGAFAASRPTWSPGPIPSAARPAATRATWSAKSAYVMTAPVSPSTSAGLSPRAAALPTTYSVSETSGTSTWG